MTVQNTPTSLFDATTSVLKRLDDLDNDAWSRDEIKLYIKDGYDQFTHRTECIFDLWVIDNLPQSANWQTDLELYIAQKTGLSHTDRPFHITGEHEKQFSDSPGGYGQPYAGPVNLTSPSETGYADDGTHRASGDAIPPNVPGGDLPSYTVKLLSVRYDRRQLIAESSTHLKELDPNYEQRTGDPQWYTWDKDGIFFLRVVPVATGVASYDTHDGSWGVLTQRLDDDSNVADTIADTGTGGWGAIVHRDDFAFPMGGQWGTPTRVHPQKLNIVAEISRLGRNLDHHTFEIPDAYLKYVYFFAAGRALERVGPGQDLELSKHYYDRYEAGVARLRRKKQDMNAERVGAFGGSPLGEYNFGLGDPQAPYPYGRPF